MKISLLLACSLAIAASAATPVTIYRDTYGVPHIYGKTDANVAFGMMYAQAEDNFWQLEDDTIRALGRSAEINGQAGFASDVATHAWETVRRAQEHYAKA